MTLLTEATMAEILYGHPVKKVLDEPDMSAKRCFFYLPMDLVQLGGAGYGIPPALLKQMPTAFYFSKADVISHAKDYAQLHPKTQVIIFSATDIVEAKRPETTQKEFKDNGELIPAREEG